MKFTLKLRGKVPGNVHRDAGSNRGEIANRQRKKYG